MKYIELIAENLKKYRELKGLSQKDLGIELGFSDKTVCAWERARVDICGSYIPGICKVLDITPNQLFGVGALDDEKTALCMKAVKCIDTLEMYVEQVSQDNMKN